MEFSEVLEIYNNTDTLLVLIFFVTVLPSLYFFLVSMPRAIRTYFFPTTEGEIISGSVGCSRQGTRYNNDNGRAHIFSTHIKYEYTVDGKSYTSKRVKWHRLDSSNHNYHAKTVNKYPKGKKVKVFYHPSKPKLALLEPGVTLESFFWVFFCVICISFVTFFIIKSA